MKYAYPYSVLGFDRETLTDEQVRSAYMDLVRRHSPDQDPEGFERIHAAYEQIETEKKRLLRRYDSPIPDWQDVAAVLPEQHLTPPLQRRTAIADINERRARQLLKETPQT
jgi:hypothetical protein